jgi:hypothetical protein
MKFSLVSSTTMMMMIASLLCGDFSIEMETGDGN